MKHASLIAATCAALLGGCVKQEYQSNARVNTDPLVVDQAMQLRDWNKSSANYENGGSKSWSTGFGYAPRGDLSYGLNYLVDLGSFFGNIATLPVTEFDQRDGVVSSGVNLPESYTAVPPVPPQYRSTTPGVMPAGGTDANGQTSPTGAVNTVNNPDAEGNNVIDPALPAIRSQQNGNVGARTIGTGDSSANNPANNTGNNAANGNTGTSDAATNDTTSGGTTGTGGAKSANSGSATGSGAGGSSGAGAGKK